MVLERLVSLREALRNPWWMFVIGGIISVSCLAVSFLVFPTSTGMFFTFLVTITMTPFMVNLIRYEEAKQEEYFKFKKEMNIIERNKRILKIYTAFFCGMIFSLSVIFFILPEDKASMIFYDQINEINIIRGKFVIADTFLKILMNNTGVLFLSFLFSFLFGAGAIFILTWNASVLSTAIGLVAKSIGGLKALPIAVLVFFPHGSLEILAYFIGGITGGIISAAVTRRKSERFWFVVRDSLQLLFISFLILVIAALIESIQIVV